MLRIELKRGTSLCQYINSNHILNTGSVLAVMYIPVTPFADPAAIVILTSVERLLSFSSLQVIVAVIPRKHMMYFDVEQKQWKQLSSLAPAVDHDAGYSYCAETVGKQLFVAASMTGYNFNYCYNIETNKWQTIGELPCGAIRSLCTIGDYMYAVPTDYSNIPQRYSFPKRQWQSFAKLSPGIYHESYYYNNGATVLHSKLYVLSGVMFSKSSTVLHCFDPATNLWEEKGATCHSHFGSTLFLVNGSRLCVAGGKTSYNNRSQPCGNPAPVEIYDEENNKWSVVKQKRIPQNNLGAVEVEGRVYFIINNFPIDSGIRIPPGEVYPIYLDDWTNLGNVSCEAALCCVPLKRYSVKAD